MVFNVSANTQSNSSTLRTSEKLGFGLGDLGFGLFWSSTNLYLLFYYTDVLGLPNSTAGFIFMVAMLWDGISDPITGIIASKTRSRWGRYRPYLLFGSIPLAFSFAMMFYKPDLEINGLIIYAAVAHILFRTCYTVLAVPYGSLVAQMTRNSDERSGLAVARMLFATAAGIIVALCTLKLAKYLGDGDLNSGFFKVALIYAFISIPIFLLTFALTKEQSDDINSESTTQEPSPSWQELLAMLKGNGPFWLIFFSVVISMAAGALSDKVGIYYLIYALNGEDSIGETLAALGVVTAISLPIWAALAKRYSKRIVWLAGIASSITISSSLYIYPLTNVASIMPFLILSAIAKGALYFSFWATLPDTVEYGEWKTGTRAAAFLVGFCTFAQKIAMGVAMGMLGIMLEVIGYQANIVQTPETLHSMKILLTLMPATALFIVFLIVYRYPIDQRMHQKLVNAIKIRQLRKARINTKGYGNMSTE